MTTTHPGDTPRQIPSPTFKIGRTRNSRGLDPRLAIREQCPPARRVRKIVDRGRRAEILMRAPILPAAERMSAGRRPFSRPAKYPKMFLSSPDGLSAAIQRADEFIEGYTLSGWMVWPKDLQESAGEIDLGMARGRDRGHVVGMSGKILL